uniref:Hepatocyte growth factor b n=1 Tax=Neogobius melanostomus TaxID=47308 RepID=A0A8C6SRI3_9GOBI
CCCSLMLTCLSSQKMNALQDYQRTDSIKLVLASPDPSHLTKSRKLPMARCARACSRNKKLPFTCRAFLYDHKKRKCQWLSFDRNSPGIQAVQNFNFDLYQKKDYVRECIVGTGQSYRGRRSVTVDGVLFPLSRIRLLRNYCRNPDNSTVGPWCFTMDPRPHMRHQHCGIPQCSQVECITCNGEDYRGPMDHSESGRECQRWDLDEPHKHLYHPKRYPDRGLEDNYCRNPDGRQRPWCFTMDPNTPWEYCHIKTCDTAPKPAEETTECYQGRGEDYRGSMDTTPTGLSCQHWDSQYPHNHSFVPQAYPCKDLKENYCRNPDGREFPWCFTTDPRVRTMFCTHIPQCGAHNSADLTDCYEGFGENYQGDLSRTRSNLPCAPWSDHANRWRGMPGLEGNACRNPDKDKNGPWCYTNNTAVRWDYCSIKQCEYRGVWLRGELSSVGCFVHKRPRIVGGSPVSITDGNWMVSIQKGSMHWCGGSLIREEWVLTDQQCFSSCVPDLSEYRVWLGISSVEEGAPDWSRGQEVSIAQVICGPDGSSLALIRAPAESIRTIQLPVFGCSIPEGTVCRMYGWGETKGTGHDEVLKAVNLPIVSNERCQNLHKGNLHISSNKICAGGRKNEGVCEDGDIKVIVGVSVHGRGCARTNQPAIFINVPFYTHWIYKVFKHYPTTRDTP